MEKKRDKIIYITQKDIAMSFNLIQWIQIAFLLHKYAKTCLYIRSTKQNGDMSKIYTCYNGLFNEGTRGTLCSTPS
jgi:hypothetical protein